MSGTHTVISNKISMMFGSEVSLKDFSFSQLIVAVKNLFDTEGVPGFVKALVVLIESLLIKSGVDCPHCGSDKHHFHSKSERKLKTSIGEVCLVLTRLLCLSCKKTFNPMAQLFDVDKYSRKSREFEKFALETVTDQSFRRSAKVINKEAGFETAHSTLHRWFWGTDAVNMNQKKQVDFLVADGTGFKKDKDESGSSRGEIRVLIGYNKNGEVIPLGAWTRANWKDIGRLIKSKNHASEKIKFKPIAKTLITDGEEEIIRHLKKLANNHQRCLFHMTHELTPLLRYQDLVGKAEAIKISDEFHDLLYLDLPEGDADPLKSLEDKLKIETHLLKMKTCIDNLILDLKMMGYKKAKTFVENAKSQLFTYIENWIKTGISNPKVTSLVERMMREIKRRIKRMGYKWSEQGAEKMTRLILLQLSSTKHFWETHWQEKIGTNANIKLTFLGVTVNQD
jgi:transposase-like protein